MNAPTITLRTTIRAKLQAVVETMVTPPPWYDAWEKLPCTPTDGERLAMYQAIRRCGTLPEEASCFLVSSLIDYIAAREADEALGEYEDRLEAIQQQYGFCEGGVWPFGTAPAGYEELQQQYRQAWGEVFACKLEQLGEMGMARLFHEDQKHFDQIVNAGRQYFFGPEGNADNLTAVWLHRLVEAVAGCMEADAPMGPLGYRYGEDDGLWEITCIPPQSNWWVAQVDGEVVAPGFHLDIEQLRGHFDQVDAIAWGSLGLPDGEGPHIAVEGVFHGHRVFCPRVVLRPQDEEPGMKFNTTPRGSG